jgi:hypothetical protein
MTLSPLVLLLGLLVTAARSADRTFTHTAVEVGSIGESSATELFAPRALTAARTGGFAVFDRDENTLLRFDKTGRSLWRFGRAGSGPGEFKEVTDVEALDDGGFIVLDEGNARVTQVSRDGKFVRAVLFEGVPRRLLNVRPSGAIHVVPRGNFASAALIANGRTSNAVALPDSLRFSADIIGEPFTASSANASVISYRWASHILVLEPSGTIRRTIRGVETTAFPLRKTYEVNNGGQKYQVTRVDPDAQEAARSVALRGDTVFVLYRQPPKGSGRVLDRYLITTGRYLGSVALTGGIAEVAVDADGRLLTLEHEPLPVVRVWEFRKR